jgi:thiamine pyrophosphate-dependent acetolactate synthase large subunit-like protein
MEAFGGKGSYAEDPKDLPGALHEAPNYRGPALVNVSPARRNALLHPAPEGSRGAPTPRQSARAPLQ